MIGKKRKRLENILKSLGSCVVAYSGGVDSGVLLNLASRVLAGRVLAVFVKTDFHIKEEAGEAGHLLKKWGIKGKQVNIDVLADKNIRKNLKERCYFCKLKMMWKLLKIAKKQGFACVIEGSNADDLNAFRPGKRALAEMGIRSPLAEAGLSKAEIRKLAGRMKLGIEKKLSSSCLATRFPYETVLNKKNLEKVAVAEKVLRQAGFDLVRVRDIAGNAFIEVEKKLVPLLARKCLTGKLIGKLKRIGFGRVFIDVKGYKSGRFD